jgi:hypothetical protein
MAKMMGPEVTFFSFLRFFQEFMQEGQIFYGIKGDLKV